MFELCSSTLLKTCTLRLCWKSLILSEICSSDSVGFFILFQLVLFFGWWRYSYLCLDSQCTCCAGGLSVVEFCYYCVCLGVVCVCVGFARDGLYYLVSLKSFWGDDTSKTGSPLAFPWPALQFLPYAGIPGQVAVLWVGLTFALSPCACAELLPSGISSWGYWCWCKRRRKAYMETVAGD